MTMPTGHSPLGASGASRWMKCPGSVGLSKGIVDEESDHAKLGTAAHELGEICLKQNRQAWELIGGTIQSGDEAIPIDKDMADAVQMYLDAVRVQHPDRNQGNSWVERQFHCPSIHKQFYGTSDFVFLDERNKVLHVWDYKHGAGVVVEVKRNPQTMYYAAGALEDLQLWNTVEHVVLHIAQPRGFHADGPIREWGVTVSDLIAWLEDELIPAMNHAEVSRDTKSGEHCRFCPARGRACPQLLKDLEEFEAMTATVNDKGVGELTNEQVARYLDLGEVMKIPYKAAQDTAFARLQSGHAIPGWKVAKKRANREFREGAEAAAQEQFKEEAYTKPELKSPAEIDKLPKGEEFTKRWAFKPDNGLTIVRDSDGRPAVNKNTKSLFQPVKKTA